MEILEYFFYKTIGKHIKNKHRVWIAKFGVFQLSYRIEKSFFEKKPIIFQEKFDATTFIERRFRRRLHRLACRFLRII